jgi:riboflavin synthase
MFNGIIMHTGNFAGYRKGKSEIVIKAPSISTKIAIGESIAINGVCLSLIRREKHALFFDLSQETLQKTNLSHLRHGALLNLELPLTLTSLLSGHLISGHIDYCSRILRITARKPGKRITLSIPQELKSYFIPKGSVAVNGVSLTVASLSTSSFEVELIPITLKETNLGELKQGDKLNIECDMVGKYVYNWMSKKKK